LRHTVEREAGIPPPEIEQPMGARYSLYLERRRLAGDEPLALDRVWLPASLAKPLLEADFTHTSLYAEQTQRTGIRLDHAHGTPVEWRHTLVRGDRFALTAEFSAGSGYRFVHPKTT
jgi:GntR family transcriptional regulator